MEPRLGSRFSRFFAILPVFLFSMSASADFTTSYCSNDNTGDTDVCKYLSTSLAASLTSLVNWTWQSNGKCSDHCNSQGTYAFAVIKFTDCWCSNYIPAQQTDTSECMVDCPGFPSEKCGDKDKDLYIYIKLAGSPSGTQSGSQPTSARVSSAIPLPSSTRNPSSSRATTVSTTRFLALQVFVILPSSPCLVPFLSTLSTLLFHRLIFLACVLRQSSFCGSAICI